MAFTNVHVLEGGNLVPGTCDRKPLLSTKIGVSVSSFVVTASVPVKGKRRGSGAYESVQDRPVDI
jgi:hypothetical protein